VVKSVENSSMTVNRIAPPFPVSDTGQPWPSPIVVNFEVVERVVEVENVTSVGATKITAVTGDQDMLHFVTPKGGANDKITLTATVNPNTQAVRDLIDWEGATEDPNNPLKATIPKNAAAKHIVKIKLNGKVCKEMRAWVVWSTITKSGDLPIEYREPILVAIGKPGASIRGGYSFTHTISPTTIITDADRPNLSGANSNDPPGGNHFVLGTPFSGGANKKWDNSRQVRAKIVLSANIADGDFTQPSPKETTYPANPVLGNDDSSTGDENNDPYNNSVLKGVDRPSLGIAHSAASNGDTYEWRLHFREFTRLELEGVWHRISDDFLWRIHLKFKKDNGKWINNNSARALDNNEF